MRRAKFWRASATLAELRIAISVRMQLEILVVEQLEGHAAALSFRVDPDGIGKGALDTPLPIVEGRLEIALGETLDGLPGREAAGVGAVQRPRHGTDADVEPPGHLAVTAVQGPLLSQNLSRLAHGQPLARHLASR
jgi:hypothetical protein